MSYLAGVFVLSCSLYCLLYLPPPHDFMTIWGIQIFSRILGSVYKKLNEIQYNFKNYLNWFEDILKGIFKKFNAIAWLLSHTIDTRLPVTLVSTISSTLLSWWEIWTLLMEEDSSVMNLISCFMKLIFLAGS